MRTRLTILLLLWASLSVAQVPNVGLQRDHPLSRGLVSWWKAVEGFTGTSRVYDVMGRNHADFLLNNNKVGWAVAGGQPPGLRLLEFLGTQTSPDYPVATTHGMAVQHLTLSAWLNYQSTTCDWVGIIAKADTASLVQEDFSLEMDCTDDSRAVVFAISNNADRFLGAIIPIQQWFHLAATYDGQTRRIYFDGVLVASGALAVAVTNTYSTLRIGYHWLASWNGYMDDIRIYNRALSAGEIALLAQPAKVGPDPRAQLQLWPTLQAARGVPTVLVPPKSGMFPFFPSP